MYSNHVESCVHLLGCECTTPQRCKLMTSEAGVGEFGKGRVNDRLVINVGARVAGVGLYDVSSC